MFSVVIASFLPPPVRGPDIYSKTAKERNHAIIRDARHLHDHLLAQTGEGFADADPDPASPSTTVQQPLSVRNDTPVVLTEKSVSSHGDGKYLFRDATGEIIIEIGDDDWRDSTVTPNTTLEIVDKVAKEVFDKTTIDETSFSIPHFFSSIAHPPPAKGWCLPATAVLLIARPFPFMSSQSLSKEDKTWLGFPIFAVFGQSKKKSGSPK